MVKKIIVMNINFEAKYEKILGGKTHGIV